MLEPIQTRSFGDTIFYTELGGVYECGEVNCETVHRWKKKFLAGTASVKDAANSARPDTRSVFCKQKIFLPDGIPHMLSVQQSLKMFPKFDERQFSKHCYGLVTN